MSLEVALHSRRKTGSPGSNSAGRTRYLAAVVTEHTWPLANLEWRKLWLDAHTGVLQDAVPLKTFQESFKTRRGSLSFVWIAPEDLDIIGPMALTLAVEVAGAGTVALTFLPTIRCGRGWASSQHLVCVEPDFELMQQCPLLSLVAI